jgi:hypothetical protein
MTSLIYSDVTRLTGEDELVAATIEENCGKNRLAVNSVERGDSLSHAAISVAQSAVALKVGAINLPNRLTLVIQNQGPKSIFVGGASVTTANGVEVFLKSTLIIDISESQTVYAISATGTQDVRIFEVS